MMYPSQYRKYMLAWNEAYAVNPQYFNDSGFKWLAKHAKRVGGSYKTSNGMIFRVFFPIYIEPALPSNIEAALDKAGYKTDKSYEYCTDKHGRKVAVGKAYQQLAKKSGESEETIKSSLEKYSEILGSTGAMMLCVSRHPYDIAGMSTGRAWKSCHTIGGDTPYDKVQRKKALVRYHNELEKYNDALDDYEKEMEVYRARESELYPQRVELANLIEFLDTELISLKRDYLDLESKVHKQFIENVHSSVFDFVSYRLDVDVPSELTGVLTESIKLAMEEDQARKVCRMELIGDAVPDVPATELQDYVEDGLFGSYRTFLFEDAVAYLFISTCNERGLDVPKYSDFFAAVRRMANTFEYESLDTLYSAAVPQAISNDIRSAARELVPKLIEIYKEKAETIVKYKALREQIRASYPVEPEEPEEPDDSPVEPGSYSGLVEQDVVTGSVIAYVIKPKANLLTSLESAKRINPKMVELLEKKLDKSNKDPIFEPRGRVILRTANRRYLRAGKVYGFSGVFSIKEQFSAMARMLTVALNKARKRDYGILEPVSHDIRERRDVTYNEGDERGDAKLKLGSRRFFPSGIRNDDLFSEYDDSDFQDEFGYDRDDFIDGLSDYVSRRVALALPKISTEEHTDLVSSLVSKVSSVPLKDVVKRMSFLLNRLKPPYSYQVGVNSLPVGFLVERFCENPDYSHADDPNNIAYYLPANLPSLSFGNPGDLNQYPVFVEHSSRNYADLEPDIAYLSSLRDMLIAANSFPGKPYTDQLVLAILKTGVPRYAMYIPDMVDQGISPVDQFKLIFIDDYNLDFDSAISQKYIAPDVPDIFNS